MKIGIQRDDRGTEMGTGVRISAATAELSMKNCSNENATEEMWSALTYIRGLEDVRLTQSHKGVATNDERESTSDQNGLGHGSIC